MIRCTCLFAWCWLPASEGTRGVQQLHICVDILDILSCLAMPRASGQGGFLEPIWMHGRVS